MTANLENYRYVQRAPPACSFGWKWCNMFQTSAFHSISYCAEFCSHLMLLFESI